MQNTRVEISYARDTLSNRSRYSPYVPQESRAGSSLAVTALEQAQWSLSQGRGVDGARNDQVNACCFFLFAKLGDMFVPGVRNKYLIFKVSLLLPHTCAKNCCIVRVFLTDILSRVALRPMSVHCWIVLQLKSFLGLKNRRNCGQHRSRQQAAAMCM